MFKISLNTGSLFGVVQTLGVASASLFISSCSVALKSPTDTTIKHQHHNTVIVQPYTADIDQRSTEQTNLASSPSPPPIVIDPLLVDILDKDIAMAKAQAQRNYQRSWETIGIRSRFVRARLLATLQKLNAPSSLQVIPVVESTYNPYALSSAGALGLWQLMPRTARAFGAHSNKHIDGRRSINDSTAAASRYLLEMHRRFQSWPLAIAAYNMGPYALKRRLKKQPWENSDGLENMPIPIGTRAYVQHVIGLVALLQDKIFNFPEPIKTRLLDIQTPVDIQRLAQLNGMRKHDVFRFNPCLNQAQYLRQAVGIHVPVSSYEGIFSKLTLAGPIYTQKIIQEGDNLWDLARTHHTSVQILKSLNPSMGKYLRIGQRLKVPANRLAQASAEHNPLLSSGHRIRYKVRSGDSLWRIASRFGTTPKAIARSNQISMKRIIRAGDILWVFAKVRPS